MLVKNEAAEKLWKCYDYMRSRTDFVPKIALVLGSGLGDYAKNIQVEAEIDYHEIEGFPVSTIAGHKGRFIFGYAGDEKKVPVVCMQGRVHYYEGYEMSDVVLPIRLMKLMGAQVLLLTNAAGGIRDGFAAGDLMLITDQISSFVPSPLNGANIEGLGVRFPDMSEIYDKKLRQLMIEAADSLGIVLKQGVYVQMQGPNYESPAEVAMCRIIGADAVGMSTACEAVAANHMGMKIAGISFLSNLACGISKTPLSHKEVQERADAAAPRFQKLVTASIQKIWDAGICGS